MPRKYLHLFILVATALLLLPFLRTGHLMTFDTWWHLTQGREILDHQNFTTETVSFTAHGVQLYSHSWLFDTVAYWVYAQRGYAGLCVLGWALLTILFSLMTLYTYSLGTPLLLSVAATAISYHLMHGHYTLRPQLVTYLCMIFTLFILRMESRWRGPMLCLVFCLWANSHGAFLFGVAFLIGATLLRALEEFVDSDSLLTTLSSRELATLTCWGGLGTIATPFGVFSYYHALQNDPLKLGIHQLVNEWQPLTYDAFPFLYWFAGIIALSSFSIRKAFLDRIILLGMTVLPLIAIRHIPLYTIICVPLSIAWISRKMKIETPRCWDAWGSFILGVIVLAIAGSLLRPGESDEEFLNRTEIRSLVPVKIAQWVSANRIQAPFYNVFENGGFLGFQWNGSPPIFIDSRIRPYRGKVIEDYTTIFEMGSGWRELLSQYHVQYALLPDSYELVSTLKSDPEWELLTHEDSFSLFEKKRSSEF